MSEVVLVEMRRETKTFDDFNLVLNSQRGTALVVLLALTYLNANSLAEVFMGPDQDRRQECADIVDVNHHHMASLLLNKFLKRWCLNKGVKEITMSWCVRGGLSCGIHKECTVGPQPQGDALAEHTNTRRIETPEFIFV